MFKPLIVCNWSLSDGHKKKFSKNKLESTGYMERCLDFCVTILLISSKILPSVFIILMKISPKMPKLDVNFVG